MTNFVSAWIEETEPRKLGPAFTAAKADLIALFAKLFKQVEVASATKSQKGMNPKFTLTPTPDAFDSYTLTVKFTYHRFPITYDFRLEPIPSPQEFIRDNIIKPLLFASLLMSKQLDEIKANNKAKIDWRTVDPASRDLKNASRDPYHPIDGIGASLLETYFRLQLDSSVFETAEICETPDSQTPSSQPTQATQQDVKFKIPTKETWKMEPMRVDSQNMLDLRYDSVLTAPNGASNGDTLAMSSSQSSSSGSGPNATSLPVDQEMIQREELEKAVEIQERLE